MKFDRRWIPFCIAMLLAAAFYAPLLSGMGRKWYDDGNYTHAFLVIPIAIWLVWTQRARLASLPISGSWWGLPLLAAGLLICLISLPGLFDYPERLSIIPILAGVVLLLLGKAHLFRLLFPILFLFFMVPIPNVIYQRVAMPLQLLASGNAVRVLNYIDIPTEPNMGNQIILKEVKDPQDANRPFTMDVAEACSGIRSLLAMTCLGAVMVYVLCRSWPKRLFIFSSSIVLAVILNVFRVTTTGFLAAKVDTSLAGGNQHEIWGIVTFALAFILLLAEIRTIDWIFKPSRQAMPTGGQASGRGDAT